MNNLQQQIHGCNQIKLSKITVSVFGNRIRYATKEGVAGHIELTDHKGYVREAGKVLEGTSFTFVPYSVNFPPIGFINKKLEDITIEYLQLIYHSK